VHELLQRRSIGGNGDRRRDGWRSPPDAQSAVNLRGARRSDRRTRCARSTGQIEEERTTSPAEACLDRPRQRRRPAAQRPRAHDGAVAPFGRSAAVQGKRGQARAHLIARRRANRPSTASKSGVLGRFPPAPRTRPLRRDRQPPAVPRAADGRRKISTNYASGLLRQANYPGAEQGLAPLHPSASHYRSRQRAVMLGETYYARKDTTTPRRLGRGLSEVPQSGKGATIAEVGMALGSWGRRPMTAAPWRG